MIERVEFYKVFGKFYVGKELDWLWGMLSRFDRFVGANRCE
jgi:hypothetical protein